MKKLFKQVQNELFEPHVLDEMAKASGVIKRLRKLSGKELLDMTLFDSDLSYNGVSMQLMQQHGLDISKQALHRKQNTEMESFIKAAFERILSINLPEEEIKGKEICIKDSTRFALSECMAAFYPGTRGAGIKAGASVQFEFELKSGKSAIKLTAANANDQSESKLDMGTIRPGIIYMRDLGYSHLGYMKNINEKKAFFINKLSPKTIIYTLQEKKYQQLELSKLQGMADVFDHQVYIGDEKLPVRIIIEPVSEEIKNIRIAQIEKYNKKMGSCTSDNFKQRAGFNFIVTNLQITEYCAELIQKLYHLRWQVELVFKAWKSFLKIHCILKTNVQRISCMLYGKLIGAVLSWKICMAIGKIGRISILKIHGLIVCSRQALREQLWQISNRWLNLISKIPLNNILKEQKKYRIKTDELLLNI